MDRLAAKRERVTPACQIHGSPEGQHLLARGGVASWNAISAAADSPGPIFVEGATWGTMREIDYFVSKEGFWCPEQELNLHGLAATGS